jgi:hypothetical protein
MRFAEIERRLRRQAKRLPKNARYTKRTQKLEVDLLPETRTAPQELKKIKSFFKLVASIPTTLPAEGQMVLQALFDCFERNGNVQEGIVEELMWGFEQCGFPRKLTAHGLVFLEKAGYVKFQTRDGLFVEFVSAKLSDSWIRYQPKLLGMVYEAG